MPRYTVLLTDYAWPELDLERRAFAAQGIRLLAPERSDIGTLEGAAAEADAIMTNWAQVPESVIAAAPRCRIVARLGIGLDNIDVAAATRRGIVVTNVPDYCLIEVAEHTLALLLALGRKVAFFHHDCRRGHYDLRAWMPIARIEGQTLGLVGLGNIGRLVARKARGLGLRVVATSRTPRSETGIEWRASLDDVLRESDYVSLHLPMTPATKHLIGAPQLALMKPTAYLINTARGGLVDHAALAAALVASKLAGAALDVQDPEPPDLATPPWNDPRVIVTPHAAFVSTESLENLRTRVCRQVIDRLEGRLPENVVNPQVVKPTTGEHT
jgi:D-3-phosphoglycerate dehydrogenase